jgi:hypothetical protein
MKKPASILVTLATSTALAVLPGCREQKGTADAASYPVKIETVEGVRTILNPAFSKEGVARYLLQDDLTIGVEGGGGDLVFNRPLDLKVNARGDIYVCDWGDVNIRVFSPEGQLLRTLGKKGQGPGEFEIPVYFVISGDHRIFVLSGSQSQLTILDSAGAYLSSFKVEGFCKALGVDRKANVYFSQLSPQKPDGGDFSLLQNRMVLFRTNEAGEQKTKLGEFPDVTMHIKVVPTKDGGVAQTQLSPDSYTTSWLVGPDDRIYLGYNKDYRLDVYDTDWKLLFRFGRESIPIRHPRYKPDGVDPEFYPAFSDWRKFFDDKGNLWLEQYVEEGIKDHVFDVFSPEGIYLRQVRVPETLYYVRGDKAYSIVRTEDEYLVVKRFRMIPLENAAK